MKKIDVEEAKRYTECSDCEAGLYVYDSRQYPSDTGAICFGCLRKRYEALRDAYRPLTLDEAVKVLNELCYMHANDWRVCGQAPMRKAMSMERAISYELLVAIAVAEKLLREKEAAG